jgi:hypothetical protein
VVALEHARRQLQRTRRGQSRGQRQSPSHSLRELATFSYAHPRRWPWRRDYLRTPELNGAVPIVGAPGAGALLTRGPVLLQVGTAFVVPTDGQ